MTPRRPSRRALAVFDRFVSDNEALKGDLIEEFEIRRSQRWLWRQVIGAVVCQRTLRSFQAPEGTNMLVLGAAVLLLVSFEAVFVVNLLHHLMFGPGLPAIAGYAYFMYGRPLPVPDYTVHVPIASLYASLAAIGVASVIGWLITPFHQRHYALSLPVFSASVLLNAALNIRLPFEVQVFTTLVFVIGLILGGRLAVRRHTWTAAPDVPAHNGGCLSHT
jgi:hypothetical protein